MNLTVRGSGDMAGIPVHGCACSLCRQARAVLHLRRGPTGLDLQESGERLLLEAGSADLARSDWAETPAAVLVCGWAPPHWSGLTRLHLGRGPALPLFGPRDQGCPGWLRRTPGQLAVQPVLAAGEETPIGRFQVHAFALAADPHLLAYGIASGEQRLAYLPVVDAVDDDACAAIAAWSPQVLVLGCPGAGHTEQRLAAVRELHQRLGRPCVLLVGIDHHLDQWLQRHPGALPGGVRIAHDGQRLDMTYLNEYRRLGEMAG